MRNYFIVFNPAMYDLMSMGTDSCASPHELIGYLANRDASGLNQSTYREYLRFDTAKRRVGMVEAFAIENGAAMYIGNQVAKLAPDAAVIQADDSRTALRSIIEQEGAKPAAVFMTAISSNFPAAVCAAIILNHAGIPVIIGGIHVSTAPRDVDLFIRSHCPHPELVAQITGPGDSVVFSQVLQDLKAGMLQAQYQGHITIEDGVWQTPENLKPLPPMCMETRGKVPLLGRIINNRIRMNSVAPYLGCPYSCNFCSISTLPPHQRRLTLRTAEDFLQELASYQEKEKSSLLQFPVFLFNTDNLLMGGRVLDQILDGIIERKMKVPFMAQISIEVASNQRLLDRLRLAGAMLFEIGFESLDMRNLEYIGKHAVQEIKRSALSASDYYARQIGKIIGHGIAIQGSFIFGLPFDRFDSLESNTGMEVADFCREHHISLMASCFSVMPGARTFQESLAAGTWMYGGPDSMDYLRALCLADHGEMNIYPQEGVRRSPLLVAVMALQALRRVGETAACLRSAAHVARKSFGYPTARGRNSLKDRLEDSAFSLATHMITAGMYRDHGLRLAASKNGIKGGLERLYAMEKDPAIKHLCRDYISGYMQGSRGMDDHENSCN